MLTPQLDPDPAKLYSRVLRTDHVQICTMLRRRTYRRRPATRRRRPITRRRYARTRRPVRRRAMTRRRILDVASIKKKDNMIFAYQLTPTATPTVNNLLINNTTVSLFMPSARSLSLGADGESQRERQLVYAKGYSERVRLQVSGGNPWIWRRLVFTLKGTDLFGAFRLYYDASTGGLRNQMVRLFPTINADPPSSANVYAYVFDGNQGLDWTSLITAKVDKQRITVVSDRTITIKPDNETGTVHQSRPYYSLEKNLLYNDDEAGDNKSQQYISTRSKAGMGDLYVMDILEPGVFAATVGSVLVTMDGTFYWHEK